MLTCEVCEKTFTSNANLERHKQTNKHKLLEQVLRGRYHTLKDMSSIAKKKLKFDKKNNNRDICMNMKIIIDKIK